MKSFFRRALLVSLAILPAWAGVPALAQPVAVAPGHALDRVEQSLAAREWARRLWQSAQTGSPAEFYDLLGKPPATEGEPRFDAVRASATLLKENLDKREADRAKRLTEVNTELDKTLAEPTTDATLSKALVLALELQMLSPDKAAALADPRIGPNATANPTGLIAKADHAAHAAEERGDWLSCSELFYRLHNLLDEVGTYKEDSERQDHRLAMLRLYVPERLWELRNQRQLAAKQEPIPPYNPVGDDFREKLQPIDKAMVVRALTRAGREHVAQLGLKQLLIGGVESLKTMAQTPDLERSFPNLADPVARKKFLDFAESEQRRLREDPSSADMADADSLLSRLQEANRQTIAVTDQSLLHEFGNGAMQELDMFSAIIWPDELARFSRSTTGKLIGIGVEIQYDELSNVRVVTPLEGGPALKAGIRAGDIIKKIDGKSAIGLTLDQAVDVITGLPGTTVTVTMERKDMARPADQQVREIDFVITREEIPLRSVKGWARTGVREDDWDWFVDRDAKIGYARLTGFTDGTTKEFDRAVKAMKAEGLQGLIVDLRFNPGGLLDEAVKIVNRFVDSGRIVMTATGASPKDIKRQELAQKNAATLNRIPVIILINEGSASASEIVSGALQDHASDGHVKALLIGTHSYGKGSVQDVTFLGGGLAALKLTTQYYLLPKFRLIHRTPGAKSWGVPPDMVVDMLPSQIQSAVMLRRDADVLALDENGKAIESTNPKADPRDLLSKGLDVQLETAVVLLQGQTFAGRTEQAQRTN